MFNNNQKAIDLIFVRTAEKTEELTGVLIQKLINFRNDYPVNSGSSMEKIFIVIKDAVFSTVQEINLCNW